jgi:hypothetical protein
MNCNWTQIRISKYTEGELSRAEAFVVRAHLSDCSDCLESYERLESVGSMLQSFAVPMPPPQLSTQIRSAISIEAARQAEPNWRWNRFKMQLGDLMRPLAVPAIGGVVSALLLVSTLLSTFWMTPSVYADDIPVKFLNNAFLSEPVMKMRSPFRVDRDFTVLAYVDANGEVYDFEVAGEEPLDLHCRGQIGNALLMSQFEPAMNFGQPMLGKVVILFQRIENAPVG